MFGVVAGLRHQIEMPAGGEIMHERAYFPVGIFKEGTNYWQSDGGNPARVFTAKMPYAGLLDLAVEGASQTLASFLIEGQEQVATQATMMLKDGGMSSKEISELLNEPLVKKYPLYYQRLMKIEQERVEHFGTKELEAEGYTTEPIVPGLFMEATTEKGKKYYKDWPITPPILDPLNDYKNVLGFNEHYSKENEDYIVLQLVVDTTAGETNDVYIELGRREGGDVWGDVLDDFKKCMGPEREHLTAKYIQGIELALQSLWFINEPDVKLMSEPLRVPSQRRKFELGKIPKRTKKIVLTGEKKVYLNSIEKTLRNRPQGAFWVKGHWRNQWYASLQEHSRKWIRPYVKGKVKSRVEKKQVDLVDPNSE
jgi:hypothetical protein